MLFLGRHTNNVTINFLSIKAFMILCYNIFNCCHNKRRFFIPLEISKNVTSINYFYTLLSTVTIITGVITARIAES